MANLKNVPKDFQSVTNLIKDFGIIDYESGTVNHMLEFCNSKNESIEHVYNICVFNFFHVKLGLHSNKPQICHRTSANRSFDPQC